MLKLGALDIKNQIGTESCTIQLVLNKNDKININKRYVLYASSENLNEIPYKSTDSLIKSSTISKFYSQNKSQMLDKVNNPLIVRLKNQNKNIEYIGLTCGGKIMTLHPILYNNLYVRLDTVLAFNEGTELFEDNEMNKRLNNIFSKNFFNRNIAHYFINSYNQNKFCLLKTKLNHNNSDSLENNNLLNLSSYISDYVYLSSKKNMIEKRLGENETMILITDSIIAFEGTITFKNLKKDYKKLSAYVNTLNDVIVEGPGLVIFEPMERTMPLKVGGNRNRLLFLTMVLVFMEFIIQMYLQFNMGQRFGR